MELLTSAKRLPPTRAPELTLQKEPPHADQILKDGTDLGLNPV